MDPTVSSYIYRDMCLTQQNDKTLSNMKWHARLFDEMDYFHNIAKTISAKSTRITIIQFLEQILEHYPWREFRKPF